VDGTSSRLQETPMALATNGLSHTSRDTGNAEIATFASLVRPSIYRVPGFTTVALRFQRSQRSQRPARQTKYSLLLIIPLIPRVTQPESCLLDDGPAQSHSIHTLIVLHSRIPYSMSRSFSKKCRLSDGFFVGPADRILFIFSVVPLVTARVAVAGAGSGVGGA